MKYFIFLFVCFVGIASASTLLKVDEAALQEKQFESEKLEETREESEKKCFALADSCTEDENGCCPSKGFSKISCQCYIVRREIKESDHIEEGPAKRECFCERTGHWYEKLGDWFKNKLG
ncbi:hypothetical protein NPIL_658031 [Nephila pilipes]|uniref:Spider venom protein n=1 Tax=Nephila pilipes TaxID=299642 RepID=A0A8X6QKT8_NEPPI|nr:hypothetical protein NPIL_658031 [Nephila pilipes]